MNDERPSLLERMARLNDLQMAYDNAKTTDPDGAPAGEEAIAAAAYIEALEYEAGLVGVLPEKPDARG